MAHWGLSYLREVYTWGQYVPSVRPQNVISLLIEAYAQRTYQALSNKNTASFGDAAQGLRIVFEGWRSLQYSICNIWQPATHMQNNMATWTGWHMLLFTPHPVQTRLSHAVQPVNPWHHCRCVPTLYAAVCFLDYCSISSSCHSQMTRSHRADFRCEKVYV